MANNVTTIQGYQKSLGYAQIASLATSTALSGIPDNTAVALIQPVGQNVRWTDDGTVPTATVGMLLQDGAILQYSGILKNLKFIQVAASAQLNITYYSKN